MKRSITIGIATAMLTRGIALDFGYPLRDGQISRLTFHEDQILFLESKISYLDELKEYFSTRVVLEGKYLY